MSSNTRQKVLVAIIVVLALIAIAEIGLLIKLKVEHEKLYIPILHKMGLIHNDQQNAAFNNNLINLVKADDKSISTAMPVKNVVQNPVVASQNNSTAQNNSSHLTDTDKQYIQSLINSNLAPINNKLNQNAVVIAAANNNAMKALAAVNTAQKNINDQLAKNNTVISAANNNATNALAAVNNVQANINDRLAKNEAVISAANNNAAQALSTANNIQKNINDRLAKDESAIAAANENANKTFASLSSTIATTTDRLAKDETAIAKANDNANKLLASMSGNNRDSNSSDNTNQATGTPDNSVTTQSSHSPATTSVTNQVIDQESSVSTDNAAQNASVTSKSSVNQTASSSAAGSTNQVQVPNSNPITVIGQKHKHHHIVQLPGVYARIMHADPSSYTIQLIADSGLQSLYEYMWAFCLGYSAIPLHTKHLGQNWYVLIYGQFNTVYQANHALQQFPYNALRWRPFVRRMSDVQRMITDPRGEDALVK